MTKIIPTCCAPGDGHDHEGHDHGKKRFDFILWGSVSIIAATLALHFSGIDIPYAHHFAHTIIEFLSTMWWGVLLGMLFVGLMNKVPKEYFQSLLGHGDSVGGIFRAALAGILLDLCSHGILLVGVKLYERGASIAQVMAFLIASPWNSFSLTLILVALIGWKWTLAFIVFSTVIAIVSGLIFMLLVRKGILPENPNKIDMPENFSMIADAKERLKTFKLTPGFIKDIALGGVKEARMLLRWLLLGVIIAAAARTFIPADDFAHWFGPTVLGLLLTLAVTTIVEVCSEGSTPIAAEILTHAHAPGNAFAFLMAGVSTDYTEIMVLRDATKSWKIPLFLPLVTVPQTLVLGYIMNHF